MNIFKKGLERKLRFNYRGRIGIEDLFSLSNEELNNIYLSIPQERGLIKGISDNDSLRIEIIKEIFNDRKERERATIESNRKEKENQIIDDLIARKKNEELEKLSIEELEKMKK